MVSRQGLDWAYGRPDPKLLRANGFGFVCRYVSTKDNKKNLTPSEVAAYLAAGLGIVVVFERSADRAKGGTPSGLADGKAAKAQADALGLPTDRPIYAAVDYDVLPGDVDVVVAYLEGFGQAVAPHPCGVYGGWRVVDAAASAGVARYFWQAGAWAAGNGTHPRAHLRQRAKTVTVDGVTCDLNDAIAPDFGAWRTGTDNAVGGDDVTPQELEAAVSRVLDKALGDRPVAKGQTTWGGTIKATLGAVQTVVNEVRGLRGVADSIKAAVDKLHGIEVNTTQVGIDQAAVDKLADALADRLSERLRG